MSRLVSGVVVLCPLQRGRVVLTITDTAAVLHGVVWVAHFYLSLSCTYIDVSFSVALYIAGSLFFLFFFPPLCFHSLLVHLNDIVSLSRELGNGLPTLAVACDNCSDFVSRETFFSRCMVNFEYY